MSPGAPGWAIVTGASSGIGREIARGLARRGYDLVLVGRRLAHLEALASEVTTCYGICTRLWQVDLGDAHEFARFVDDLQRDAEPVRVLVNNAGFGVYGEFSETDWDAEARMIEVHIIAATRLAKVVCRSMKRRGAGRILNVASMSAFRPGPLGAVYAATKAYTVSLSESLAEELKGTGVTVTALCPGYTFTDFTRQALRAQAEPRSPWRAMNADVVAEIGLDAMFSGRRVVAPGIHNRLELMLIRLLPRRWMAWLTYRVRAKRMNGDGNGR